MKSITVRQGMCCYKLLTGSYKKWGNSTNFLPTNG